MLNLSTLNPQQRLAVETIDGPVLILAGAGTGKTRVITFRIAHMIERGVAPGNILGVTFTNKAAREMQERVSQLIPRVKKKSDEEKPERPTVCTFHSLCVRILREHIEQLGYKRNFVIYDESEQLSAVRKILSHISAKGEKTDPAAVLSLLSRFKNGGARAAVFSEPNVAALAQHVRLKYESALRACNAVDFDDLIRLPVQVLENDAQIASAWRERIGYLLVDECQDTNGAQYRLLRQLAGPRGAITCVGDDDQSIYAWRGANPENLEQLGRDYPNLKVIALEQNYRCSRRILRAANTLIANNPHLHVKKLWSDHGEGEPIRVWECRNNEHEAERVAAEIRFLHESRRVEWGDFSVLFRGNHQSRPLEKALQLQGIPYHLTGGTAFLDRGEVKDALAWLRVLANPEDDAAFLRAIGAPKREVGTASLAKLAEMSRHAQLPLSVAAARIGLIRQLPARAAAGLAEFTSILDRLHQFGRDAAPADLCRKTIEASGLLASLRAQCKDDSSFARRRVNLDELSGWLEGAKGSGPEGLASQLTLLGHADRGEPGNAVRLMSLHAAKGLEFGHVFVIGLEDGLMPHEASLEEGRLDEERRLMYVGITRAKAVLTLSYSRESRRWGELQRLLPSRFLAELPADDLLRDGSDPGLHAEVRQQRTKDHLSNIAALLGK